MQNAHGTSYRKLPQINLKYKNHKKKYRNLSICDNMDGPRGHYAKWNKLDRQRQILYDITYNVESKKYYNTDESIYKTETDS